MGKRRQHGSQEKARILIQASEEAKDQGQLRTIASLLPKEDKNK